MQCPNLEIKYQPAFLRKTKTKHPHSVLLIIPVILILSRVFSEKNALKKTLEVSGDEQKLVGAFNPAENISQLGSFPQGSG